MAHHTSPSILVVDDETAICQSCSEVLEPEGYAVTVCNCGETGLQTYLKMIPDIAFIDIKMPGMSGMELLERIRDHDKNAVLIVITGFVSIESAISSMKLGAFDFLPKPFTPNELRIIAARGIKHRRAVQEAMRLRLEKERMKETFVSMVSHQLKGPLAVVQQYFDVVLGEMIGTLNEDQKNTLSRCRVRVHELLHLIDSWLAYSRIDPSMLQKEYTDVDIVAMFHEIISFLDPTAKAQGVTITVQADRSVVIRAHRDFLREALTNLISNGISYNHAGGTVTIVVTVDQPFVNIEIQDTGVGIDEESLPFIFEEFYRSNRTKLVVGSGLGLSIVQRIIDGHRGSISVRSAVGKGTTFKVTLPLQTGK
jgi:two-component system sensor histidine kinase/response regulator